MAGSASFFQTWPREGRRLRHLRRQARPSPVPRQAAPEGLRAPQGPEPPSSARPATPPRRPRGAWKPGRPRGGPGGAAPRQARPPPGRASREAANMAPSVTQPPRPPSPPATRTRAPSGRGPSGRAAQSLLFHPSSSPWPRGPAGAKELMPARSLPPPRLPPAFPCPRPSCEQRLARAVAGARWPAGGHHYLQVIGGAGARGGSAYCCRGPVPQLQVDPLLHVHVSLVPPLQT